MVWFLEMIVEKGRKTSRGTKTIRKGFYLLEEADAYQLYYLLNRATGYTGDKFTITKPEAVKMNPLELLVI